MGRTANVWNRIWYKDPRDYIRYLIDNETDPTLALTEREKAIFETIPTTAWDQHIEDIGLVYEVVEEMLGHTNNLLEEEKN